MSVGPYFDYYNIRRSDLFDSTVLKELNTYRNWGPFTAPIAKIEQDEDPKNDRAVSNKSVKSLFNPVYSVGYNQFMQVRQNAPLLDSPEMRAEMRKGKDCTIKGLVEASQRNMLGRSVYSYADFMYCKHLGKVSNNYLLTLRRFAFPCGDHINYSDPFVHIDPYEMETEKHAPDIGRLVTWMGVSGNEMSKILSWSVKMPFEEMTSGIETADGGGDKASPLGTFLNATTSAKYRDQMVKGYSGGATFGYMQKLTGPLGGIFSAGGNPPYEGNMGYVDHKKAEGPVNVIHRTNIRKVGLEFTHDIDLVFEYELRSYDGINGKAAFLDLLGNILAVTYDNGAFWGGAYRGTGSSQSNVFANLPIFKLNGNSSFSDVVSSFVDSGKSIWSSLGGGSGNVLTDFKNVANTILKGAFSAFLGAGLNALGRPQKHGIASLLSPMPVGMWHLTVGNPWNPIMMIGNLIMDNATIEQYGPLGLDDFPTGIRVTCKLKHGKDRDSTQIEHMFMQGENRIYTPVDSEVMKMYEAADPIDAEKNKKLREGIVKTREKYAKWKDNLNGTFPELSEKDPGNAVNILKYTTMEFTFDDDGFVTSAENKLDIEGYGKAVVSDLERQKAMTKLSSNFYQWFGTNDEEVISTIAKEAAFGSKNSGKDVTGAHK